MYEISHSFINTTFLHYLLLHQLTVQKSSKIFSEVLNIIWYISILSSAPPAGFTPVIRQNKTLSLRITSLLLSDHHLLIGTSTGITLTLPLPVTSPKAQLSHLPHGHIDSVSFLCQLHCHNSILILSGGTGYENLTTSSTAYKITDSASCLLLWRPITKQDSPD